LAEGHGARAPYDAVLVLGGVERNLDGLMAQLKPGGTLAAVETTRPVNGRRVGRATLFRQVGDELSRRPLFDLTVPVLPEFQASAGFVF
jgi:protein-L-isoaspartate(D-aspartate) O-methyltransferase